MSTTHDQTLHQIASGARNRTELFDRLLRHVAKEYAAIGGLAWNCTQTPFRPICQVYDPKDDKLSMSFTETEHRKLLKRATESKDPIILRSSAKADANAKVANRQPTILLLRLLSGNLTEVVEVFFRHDVDQVALQKKVVDIAHLCRAAVLIPLPPGQGQPGLPGQPAIPGNLPDLRANLGNSPLEMAGQMAGSSKKQIPAQTLDAFIHTLHQSLDPTQTAREICNEVRRVLDCDRVTVVKTSGKRFKVTAISGQPSVNRRSNTVQLLKRVAEKVLPTRQPFWYPDDGEGDQLPPQIQKPLDKYLAIAATRTMVAVPFFDRIEETQDSEVLTKPRTPATLIGGIIIEHCNEQWERHNVSAAVELASRHAGDAYRNAWQHHNLFLYPVWHWIGKSKVLFAARNLGKTALAGIGLLALTLAMIFVPTDFQMSCDGQLVPTVRQNVFPHVNGVVDEVMVKHGDEVTEGQPLLQLTNLDLDYQITELRGQISELEQMIKSTRTSRLRRVDDQEAEMQKQNLQGQEAELKSMKVNLQRLEQKQEKLTVRSPINGEVMTWDLQDKLKQRPVSVNDRLIEIADVDGVWQLELNLPDRKVGHFMNAYENSDEPLKVEFILAADPSKQFNGHVIEVGKVAEIDADNEQTLKIKVAIDSEDIEIRQSKSGVSAHITCGECSLGYSWLHPVYEAFQTHVLFPLW